MKRTSNMKRVWLASVLVLSLLAATISISPGSVSASSHCQDLYLLFVGGQGSDGVETKLNSSITPRLRGVGYTFDRYQYPDGLPPTSISDWRTVDPNAYFGRVEAAGATLRASLDARNCPNEVVAIMAHGQGADVVNHALRGVDASRIAVVAYYGDPRMSYSEGGMRFDCADPRISPEWRRGSADCTSIGGILGKRTPYHPPALAGRVISYCDDNDSVCTGRIGDNYNVVAHGEYGEDNAEAQISGAEISLRIRGFLPDAVGADIDTVDFRIKEDSGNRDMAFLLHTTSSMSEEIAGAKSNALAVAQLVLENGGRVALVEYRDECDYDDAGETAFVAEIRLDFTSDLNVFTSYINNPDNLNIAGGCNPKEAVLYALMKAMGARQINPPPGEQNEFGTGLSWRPESQK